MAHGLLMSHGRTTVVHVSPPNPVGHWHMESVVPIASLASDKTDEEAEVGVRRFLSQQSRCEASKAHATQSSRSTQSAAQCRANEPTGSAGVSEEAVEEEEKKKKEKRKKCERVHKSLCANERACEHAHVTGEHKCAQVRVCACVNVNAHMS